jgi:hypothetical protein
MNWSGAERSFAGVDAIVLTDGSADGSAVALGAGGGATGGIDAGAAPAAAGVVVVWSTAPS